MDGVRASIIGGPRRLSRHRRAHHPLSTHPLNCEEPDFVYLTDNGHLRPAVVMDGGLRRFFKRFAQTLTYAPHFVSVVVLIGMMTALLDPRTGMVNRLLELVGLDAIAFMQDAGWFRHLFVWSGVWQSLGWGTIIYLAALAGVNPELHQAPEVDGASRLQRIRHVNVPAILPTVVILFILDFGSFMSVGFEKVLLMSNSLNAETSDIIQAFVYKSGLLQGQYGYAAAVGLFDSVINILIIIGVNHLARRISDNSLW